MAYTTIDDPSKYFQSKAFTGNGTDSTAYTFDGNSDLQPDLLWFKSRSASGHHQLIDSTRGVNTWIGTSDTGAEATNPSEGYLDSLESDGWTSADGSSGTHPNRNNNQNTVTYVAWGWKANGGTTATNSNGNIDTTVQTNTTAGFSIVQWEGANSTATLGHGLGAVPELIISKCIDTTQEWGVYHQAVGNDDYFHLNENAAEQDNAAYWNDTTPTSTVWSVGNSGPTNDNGDTMIAYVFTPIQGYSKFGSYKGNHDANGPFIYTGFKPAFVLIKEMDNANDWDLRDSARNPHNHVDTWLRPNTNDADGDSDAIDFLSNGFKIRQASNRNNRSNGTLVYIVFAESPFVSSKGIPTTAR